ncbi:MAG: hypothetical protein Q8S31_07800 [Alphaproteobacteria bacterium]|nr:hypothetical protein [Alphaproteobacteria bacterium]
MLRRIGQHEKSLDKISESLILRLGLYYIHSPSIRFKLSEYGGSLDILWNNASAMNDFSPKDPDSIDIDEILEKSYLLDKIMKKYRLEIKTTKSRKMYQARIRALKIINFLFKDKEDIYIVIQGNQREIQKRAKHIIYNLKGPKVHSNFISIKYPYEEEEEECNIYFRSLFRHRFSDLKLNSLLKKIIYNSFLREIYFISTCNPNIIINIYDDLGIDVVAHTNVINKLQEEFKPWVKEIFKDKILLGL